MVYKTGDVLGANIFVYCDNNPVSNIDETGYAPSHLSTIIREVFVTIVAVWALQSYLFKGAVINSVSKFHRDLNGMYYINVRGAVVSGGNFN